MPRPPLASPPVNARKRSRKGLGGWSEEMDGSTRLTKAQYNRRLVRAIIHQHGPISRAQLRVMTGLPLSALTGICADLAAEGFIEQKEQVPSRSGRGRRLELLDINRKGLCAICLLYGQDCVEAQAVDLEGEVRWRRSWDGPSVPGREQLLKLLTTALSTAIRECGFARDRILACGVGDPGLIDRKTGVAIRAINLPGWRQVPLRQVLGRVSGMPVLVERAEGLRALGENAYGGAGRSANMLYAELTAEGITGALVVDGRPVGGRSGSAGEIGHMRVRSGGPLCRCGLHGCLEALVAPSRLVEQWLGHQPRRAQTSAEFQRLLDAARSGEQPAQRILRRAAEDLAAILGSVVNLLDPGVIVLGGLLAAAPEMFIWRLRQALRESTLEELYARLLIRTAEVDDAAARGLSVLVQEHVFVHPNRSGAFAP